MTVSKANQTKRLHLLDTSGVLYVIGIGVWMIFVSCSGASYPVSVSSSNESGFGFIQLVFYVAAFFIVGIANQREDPSGHYPLFLLATVCLGLTLLLNILYMNMPSVHMLLLCSAATLGAGTGLGYCQWFTIISTKSMHDVKVILVLGSLFSIVSCILLNRVSLDTSLTLSIYVFAPLSLILMWLNIRAERSGNSPPKKTDYVHTKMKTIMKDVSLPLICAMALVLITPIASVSYVDTSAIGISEDLLAQIASFVALACIFIIWFPRKKEISLPQFYCIFLPILASTVFITSFAVPSTHWAVLFLGDANILFVSLLMITTCLLSSRKLQTSPVAIYGIFGGCVYFSGLLQRTLQYFSDAYGFSMEPLTIAMFFLYMLMIPTFFLIVSRTKGRKRIVSEEGTVYLAREFSESCTAIAEEYKLSARQTEILRFLIAGRDVTCIAGALYLSPNTVRSYKKGLYAALDVHGKQQLIDLVEAKRQSFVEMA